MNNLWSKAVFRWCVYQTPLLVFGILLKGGVFDRLGYNKFTEMNITDDGNVVYSTESRFDREVNRYEFIGTDLSEWWVLIWILILAIPAVWVWRKPLFSWLNRIAEEG